MSNTERKIKAMEMEGRLEEFRANKKAEAEKTTYKLSKVKNDWDEYTVVAWCNGKRVEEKCYYTDDWDDAVATKLDMQRREEKC